MVYYLKPKNALGAVSKGSVDGVVAITGATDAEPYVIPADYTIVIDGKRVTLSGLEGTEVYLGVQPGDYPDNENERQRRSGYLTRLS